MRIEIEKILCPVDFSESSDHALQYGRAFAQAYGAELVLFHVIETPYLPSYSTFGIPDLYFPMEEIHDQCRQKIDELVEKYGGEGFGINGVLETGVPFLEIVRKAKEEEFDLIVLGTHGHTGLKHMIIGSVAEKVVRKAPCPVLSVHHPEHEFVVP